MQPPYQEPKVIRVAALDPEELERLCDAYGMRLEWVADGAEIPGSYWQAPEAGLLGNRLYARRDTPVHSLLHEGCHYICMDAERRNRLDTDAGGEFVEENAVCYLQILLADRLTGIGREQMMADMDRWGYTFRLGSARAWFEGDAADARAWLLEKGIIDAGEQPTGRCCP